MTLTIEQTGQALDLYCSVYRAALEKIGELTLLRLCLVARSDYPTVKWVGLSTTDQGGSGQWVVGLWDADGTWLEDDPSLIANDVATDDLFDGNAHVWQIHCRAVSDGGIAARLAEIGGTYTEHILDVDSAFDALRNLEV